MSEVAVAPSTGLAGHVSRRPNREAPTADFLAAVETLRLEDSGTPAEAGVRTPGGRDAPNPGDGETSTGGDDAVIPAPTVLAQPLPPILLATPAVPPPADQLATARGTSAPTVDLPDPLRASASPAGMELPAEADGLLPVIAREDAMSPAVAAASLVESSPVGARMRLQAAVTSVETHFAAVTPRHQVRDAVASIAARIADAGASAANPVPATPAVVSVTPAPGGTAAVPEFMPPAARQSPQLGPRPAADQPDAPSPSEADVRPARAPAAPPVPPSLERPRETFRLPAGSADRPPARSVGAVARAPDGDVSAPAQTGAPSVGLGAAEIRRLATTIIATANDIAAPARPDTAAATPGAPLRVVTLTLNPEHLGRVSLTIRLVGDRLSVRMDAENEETARMIEGDGEALVRLLDSEGYDVDSVTATATAQRELSSPTPTPTATPSSGSAVASHPGAGSERQPPRHAPGDGRTTSPSSPFQDSETASHEDALPPRGVDRIYV